MKNLFLYIVLFFAINVKAQPAGYSFGKHILINESQIPGTTALTNFPLLIQLTDNDLRHTSSGGSVSNINGYDIIFTLGDCSTQLNHEIEHYNPTNGNLIAWVRIPSLSATVDMGIHMYYGNNAIASNPSTSSTWSAGYNGVWHLHNDFLDASGNANNGTNNGSVDLSPAQLADGQTFTDPNHWIELPSHPNITGSFTCSAWFRTTDNTRTGQRIICDDATNANGCWAISLGDPGTGSLRFYIRGLSVVSLDTPNLISNNTWYHVVIVYDNVSNPKIKTIYLNGTSVATGTVTGVLGTPTGNASIGGEVAAGETANRFQGNIDEVRSIPSILSANWISAEYNNQSNPSAFYTISAQMTATDLCATLPVEFIDFNGQFIDLKTVSLIWSTASESNNDYFIIEKSKDGINWNELAQLNGQGTSNHIVNYQHYDYYPYANLTYYRLKQVDFDGSQKYLKTISVTQQRQNIFSIYPIPSNDFIYVNHKEISNESFKIYNSLGQIVNDQISITSNNEVYQIDITNLEIGIYFVKFENGIYRFIKN